MAGRLRSEVQPVSADDHLRRSLTEGEVVLVRSVFGDAIDCSKAGVAHSKWAFFQPRHVTMAPTGTIHFHPGGDSYRDDFADAALTSQGLFIHEMTHVWQTQRSGRWWLPLMRHPFCRYGYRFVPGQPFERYGIEQQAEIVRHAFLARLGLALVPHASELDSLLPFR